MAHSSAPPSFQYPTGALLGAFHDTGVPYLGVAVASGLALVLTVAACGR